MLERVKDVFASTAAVLLLLYLFPVAAAGTLDSLKETVEADLGQPLEWLEKGEEELTVKALFKTEKATEDGKPEVSRFEYSPDTIANLAQLLNQRTRKLVVYYCGNINRQLDRFVADHSKDGKTLTEVTSAMEERFKKYDGQKAFAACDGVKNGKSMRKEHIPLFTLSCVGSYFEKHPLSASQQKEVGEDTLSAMRALQEIMTCPREMVLLARRQLEIEYQHDGLKQAVAAGYMNLDQAQEWMSANPVPDRAQFREKKNDKREL